MGRLILFILAFLCATSLTFEVTIYNNVDDCNTNDETEYRIIEGVSDGACYTFDEPWPNTSCRQYVRGGAENGPCDSGSLLPRSILTRNQNRICALFAEPGCKNGIAQLDRCAMASEAKFDLFKSFSCHWDGTVDILGNVGCKNGQSTGVCVNDCGCLCNGIALSCPSDEDLPPTCTKWALQACKTQCDCISP